MCINVRKHDNKCFKVDDVFLCVGGLSYFSVFSLFISKFAWL